MLLQKDDVAGVLRVVVLNRYAAYCMALQIRYLAGRDTSLLYRST